MVVGKWDKVGGSGTAMKGEIMKKHTDTRERRVRDRILRTSEAMACVEMARHALLQDRNGMLMVRRGFKYLEDALEDRMRINLGVKPRHK